MINLKIHFSRSTQVDQGLESTSEKWIKVSRPDLCLGNLLRAHTRPVEVDMRRTPAPSRDENSMASGQSDNKPIQIRAANLAQRELLFSVAEATGNEISTVTRAFWSWWLGEAGAELPRRPPVAQDLEIDHYMVDGVCCVGGCDHGPFGNG